MSRQAHAAAVVLAMMGCDSDKLPAPTPSTAPSSTPPARAPDPAVPELTVPRVAASARPTIDGKLEEPAWKAAAETSPFVNVSTGKVDARSKVQGRAKLLYDDEFLFMGFTISDTAIRGGFASDEIDPLLWTSDTVEVMLDPDGDGDNKDYYEIQIGPQNLVFDSRFDAQNTPGRGNRGPFGHQSWSAKLQSAVTLKGTLDNDSDKDEGYLVEAKVPWSSFDKAERTPPKAGDQWRMNFYAIQNTGGVAWSPMLRRGNFHFAPRFGKVTWGSATVP